MSGPLGEMRERLRRAVERDLRPVRPLAAPWRRAVVVLTPVVVGIAVVVLGRFHLRPDLDRLGPLLSWLPLGLQVLLGLGLVVMALREAVPGLGVSRTAIAIVCAAALGLYLTVNLLICLRSPSAPPGGFVASVTHCIHYEVLLGVPLLVAVAWLAATALPVRPQVIGLLAGAGAGVMADAFWRLVCPISSPSHFLLAHGGAIVLLGAVGYASGRAWERLHLRG